MKLEDYIKELKTCPDGELTSRLGVYDNFPVLINLDYDIAQIKLYKTPRLKHIERENKILEVEEFHFDDNIHVLRLHSRPYNLYYLDKKTKKKIQKADYKSYFFLHPYQVEKPPFDEQRKMADMILYLSEEFLIKNKIPALFPIQGADVNDLSKFVFYAPRKKK
jgi:hypothetical protein